MDYVVLMNNFDALQHLTPVKADEIHVELGVFVAVTEGENIGKVAFAAFHELLGISDI